MNVDDHPIVFFDGVCNFCNATVDWIWKRNHKESLYFSSLQSEFADGFLKDRGIEHPDLSTIYFLEQGQLHEKSKAVLRIIRHCGVGYIILSAVLSIFPSFLGDFIYDQIAKRRYRISGRRDTCRIPTQEESNRFFD